MPSISVFLESSNNESVTVIFESVPIIKLEVDFWKVDLLIVAFAPVA